MRDLLVFIFTAGIIAGLVAFETWAVMSLWNWLAPIFWSSCPILSFWQTLGVIVLINIIASFFKSSKS